MHGQTKHKKSNRKSLLQLHKRYVHSKFTYSVFIYFVFFMGPCLCNPDTKVVITTLSQGLKTTYKPNFPVLNELRKTMDYWDGVLVGGETGT
jgi:hypothetical protein